MTALHGMARYHKERKDWVALIVCCEEGLRSLPEATGGLNPADCMETRLLLLLADVAEARGGVEVARKHDGKAKRLFYEM